MHMFNTGIYTPVQEGPNKPQEYSIRERKDEPDLSLYK